MKHLKRIFHAFAILFFLSTVFVLKGMDRQAESAKRYSRLVIRNVTIIDGKGTPPRGPADIIVTHNTIHEVRGARKAEEAYEQEAHVLDGSGMYALPGLINIHAHVHDRRGERPLPVEYVYKLWLSCGITSVRDVGSDSRKTLAEREKSRKGTIAAPRIFLYMWAGGDTPEKIRERIQQIKRTEGDGIKIFGMDRDLMKVALDEAHKQDLKVVHHVGVEETDAWDDAAFGVASIEHWYGVPDAALHGSQNFPHWYTYSDENDRFRYAGRLWREADPEKLRSLLKTLVKKNVAWCPTFVIYEANRDLLRAENQPWFKEYLHPVLEEYFKPNPAFHGSYHWDWTTTDEIFWRENYRIWMKAVRDFAKLGGVVGCGEDAGYIYMLYGFGLIRELELHQEAGFHPIDVIQHATGNNAKILGVEDKLGRLRSGFFADIILVKGNPLENLKYLYPTGVLGLRDGEIITRGGVEWTIKDGFVYHAPSLLDDVKRIVTEARTQEIENDVAASLNSQED